MLHPLLDGRVARNVHADARDRFWVAGITQHKRDEGWLYLSVVIDAVARPVVVWPMADRMKGDLVANALEMVMKNREPEPGALHASDQRAQCTALSFGKHLERSGVLGSMGSVASAMDEAVAESFFASLQTELLDRRSWPARDAFETAIFDCFEIFYNRTRRHSKLDCLSALNYAASNPIRTSLATARLQPFHQTG